MRIDATDASDRDSGPHQSECDQGQRGQRRRDGCDLHRNHLGEGRRRHRGQASAEAAAEALGPLYGGTGGIEPMLEPKSDIFKPFVRIAQIAGVDISDLG